MEVKSVHLVQVADLPACAALDKYRKQAAFDWKQLRIFVEQPLDLKIKMNVWTKLASDPLFGKYSEASSTDEQKRVTCHQLVRFASTGIYDNLDTMDYKQRTKFIMCVNEATAMVNPCLSVKIALGISLFANVILGLGTERHLHFYRDVWDAKILSCLAITELAHGSDTKRMRTVAEYDPAHQQFVINTPDVGAAKCWVGNLGKQCTHALLFAQLIAQNTNHGLHLFVVPIRDPKTLLPYPGITVGDIGEKAGLHGIDNGFIMFHKYRIPRENLLNRTGDITPEGEYETSFSDPQRILGAALENLSCGRVAIMQESSNTLAKATVIAVRYAAQRTQFTDQQGIETPLIEYQLHQWRLFPYVAAAYALKFFIQQFTDKYLDCVVVSKTDTSGFRDVQMMVSGVHAIVCCTKPLFTWICRNALQECREACGGHGFLKSAGLSEMRANHDAKVTYEGDNNVLLQTTSQWLLRQAAAPPPPPADEHLFPASTVRFMAHADAKLNNATVNPSALADVCNPTFIVDCYEWLLCWLLRETRTKRDQCQRLLNDPIAAKSLTQVYAAHTLAIVFAEYNVVSCFWSRCQQSSDAAQRALLENLFYLFALWSLHKHVSVFYQGGLFRGGQVASLMESAILELCRRLKASAVAAVDALAPPDFVVNSVLGCADGKLYERLIESMTKPGSTDRPTWWKEMVLKANL